MATEVTLPQLGESVTEGTITAWLVEVGDHVDADQPLFELSSEKIDTEVPAPTSGVLQEIKVSVDETVDVGTVVAVIADEGEAGGDGQAPQAEEQEAGAGDAEEAEAEEAETEEAEEPAEQREPAAAEQPETAEAEEREPQPSGNGGGGLASPIVRRMAREHGIDVSALSGSGKGGRVTREDVEAAIEGKAPEGEEKPEPAAEKRAAAPSTRADVSPGERERSEDLSRVRRRIASRMMESLQSSAQLTTVQEADVTRLMNVRARLKDEFTAREGTSLSPFVFLARAAVIAIKRHPFANAQADWDAGKVKFHEYVNLGIAVDTERGLMVPNVKNADDLTLPALARAIKAAADKARGKGKLEMQDIEGGTFTVTNTGSRGVLLDTPILNYPEVAILATGAIQKRPIVVSDDAGPAMAIRDMVYLCLTYDHRLLDGADAARFVTDVKQVIESHDWEAEVGY